MDIISSSKITDTPDTTPQSSQIVTIHSDNDPFPTTVTLTETNYALWYQVMEMRIAARDKLGNGAPIHKYYSQLYTIFQEIDHHIPNRMHCDTNMTERQTELDRLGLLHWAAESLMLQ
ncbi:hypothetical protein L3X38_026513 [Prunus dulcis]|uniref:Retrotransposon Copia-like N-terminal domain-containing protein n=1 Tax=Prunus dulcis TaxID=3755 RepID=A0AAD4VMZ7_PRUDU|nr:hypothetical protein L3X38_026513 [Prunus dulcis]